MEGTLTLREERFQAIVELLEGLGWTQLTPQEPIWGLAGHTWRFRATPQRCMLYEKKAGRGGTAQHPFELFEYPRIERAIQNIALHGSPAIPRPEGRCVL